MKNFKFLSVLLLFTSLLIFSCSVDESINENVVSELNLKGKDHKELIGKIINGTATITVDKSKLLKDWNTRLLTLNRSLNTKLNQLEIKVNTDKDLILVASSKEYSSSRILLVEGNNIFVVSLAGVTITCETVSCASNTGCEARRTGDCSPCSGDCKKTTTITDL